MKKNIILIGMPGSGKSTIGLLLSKELNMQFIDMDEYIKKYENKSIKEMFEIGEECFRDAETKVSSILSKLNSTVIATGGGIVKRKENINYFKYNSIVVFINRPIEFIVKDIDINTRPLLKDDKEKIYTLYKNRFNLYKEACDIEVINQNLLTDVVNLIIERVREIENKCY